MNVQWSSLNLNVKKVEQAQPGFMKNIEFT